MIDLLWLADMFEEVSGLIEVRCFDDHGNERPWVRFCDSLDAAEAALEEISQREGWNVYVAMATRRVAGDGSKANAAALRALWIDYDFEAEGEGDREVFDVKLETFPLPPSAIVDSGGGRHCYWFLEDPFDVSTDDGKRWVEETLKGLQSVWESDNKVVDVARIMRVPGTTNWPDEKKRGRGREPADCTVLARDAHFYAIDEFESFTERGRRERAARQIPATVEGPPKELPERIRSILESSPRGQALFLHQESALPKYRANPNDKSASVFDYHLIGELLRHPTLTRDEIVGACQAARARAGSNQKADRPDYWERTFNLVASKERARRGEEPKAGDYQSRMRQLIRNPNAGRASAIFLQELTADARISPRFPSGLKAIDEALQGLYGFSSIGGRKNVGKSTFLLGSSIEASMADWTVAYFDGENAGNVWNRRVMHYFQNQALEVIRSKLAGLSRYWVGSGAAMDDVKEWVCATIGADTKQLLVVFDSLNTVVNKLGRRMDYFDIYTELLLWMQDVRAATQGHVAFLVASELNKEGEMLGRKIEAIQDVGIMVAQKKDGGIMVNVDKSRETKKPSSLPDYEITDNFRLAPVSAFDDDGPPPTGGQLDLEGGKVIPIDRQRSWWDD